MDVSVTKKMKKKTKPSLKAIDIIKETLKIFIKNPNLIIFTILISLPLFLFSLYFQTLLRTFLLKASQSLITQHHETFSISSLLAISTLNEAKPSSEWARPLLILANLTSDDLRELLRLGILYLAPLNLLTLFSLIPIVDLSSKLFRDDHQDKPLTLKEMLGFRTRLTGKRLKGIFVTFLFAVAFSSSMITGLAWLLFTYRIILRSYNVYGSSYNYANYYYFSSYIAPLGSDIWFTLLFQANLWLLFGIFLGWGAIWNLGLVVSVLEDDRCGTRALGSAGFLCLRNFRCGLVLMFVYSALEVGSKIPWLWFDDGSGSVSVSVVVVVVVQTGLFCAVNAIKWVGFVVYFDGCVKRLFAKKDGDQEGIGDGDLEEGSLKL